MKQSFLVLAASVALVGAAGVTAAEPASAIDPTKGYAGICTGADALTGTTMVVDFQQLDGNGGTAAPTITRCSPNPNPGTSRTGVQALQDAGIAPTGVQRWGLAFICRLEGRPSATESIPVSGNPTYKEACVNTPPAAAYWGYWHADGSGSTWTYSSYGAGNRTVTPGGFDGWSFSLNATASTNPVPRVTPLNTAVGASNPTVSLSVDDLDRTITLGQTTTLTWSSTNTTTRTASVTPSAGAGTWSGSLAVSGSTSIKPTAKGTYTYKVTGVNGAKSASSTATLTVK